MGLTTRTSPYTPGVPEYLLLEKINEYPVNTNYTSPSVQHPERFLFDLSTPCSLPVSRRCSRQAAKCLRPANIPVLLGGENRPMTPPSKHPGAARRSRSPQRPMPPPSKHPGAARRSRSLYRNARKLLPYLCDWEYGAGG